MQLPTLKLTFITCKILQDPLSVQTKQKFKLHFIICLSSFLCYIFYFSTFAYLYF